MDNDNDFLTKVAEGVLELKRNCSSPSELAALIYPLRVLASLDQPPVRDKAVSCLKQLADGQNRGTPPPTQPSSKITTTRSLPLLARRIWRTLPR